MEFPFHSREKSPQFKRPPVSQWMSPPKSSDLPLLSSSPGTARKRIVSSGSGIEEPSAKHIKDDEVQPRYSKGALNLDVKLDSSKASFTSLKRGRDSSPSSRNGRSDDRISLQLSPRVSVTVHSSRASEYVLPSKSGKNEKISMKIRSRGRHHRKRITRRSERLSYSGSDSDSSGKSDDLDESRSNDSELALDGVPIQVDARIVEPKNSSRFWQDLGFTSGPSTSHDNHESVASVPSLSRIVSMAKPVRKTAVLSDFVPSQGVVSGREQKELQTSPKKTGLTVKRVEIPEFKPPYSFSPPQKLSPPKSAKHQEKSAKNAKENVDETKGAVSARSIEPPETSPTGVEKPVQIPGSGNHSSPGVTARSIGGELKEILLNNGKPDTTITPRKRNIDVKAAQDYMKEQKKRRHQFTEKEKAKRKIEIEEKKKKLEELRVKSLQLAAASRKKKRNNKPKEGIRTVENEEDTSASLGLRPGKPKRSFQQSLAVLRNSQTDPDMIHNKKEDVKKAEVGHITSAGVEMEDDVTHGFNLNQLADDFIAPTMNWDFPTMGERWRPKSAEVDELTAPQVTPLSLETSNSSYDLNAHLQKLAEVLQSKIDSKTKKHVLTDQGDSVTGRTRIDSIPNEVDRKRSLPAKEKRKNVVKSHGDEERGSIIVAVDSATIASLRREISEIAESFKLLQEKLMNVQPKPETLPSKTVGDNRIPDWLRTIQPRPHPYNVFTAVKNKLRVVVPDVRQGPSEYLSDFESSIQQPGTQGSGASERASSSLTKRDSGSDLSSSILDSQKFVTPAESEKTKNSQSKGSISSICESVRSIPTEQSARELSSYKENIVLMPPDIRVISNNLSGEILNNAVIHNPRPEEEKLINTEQAQTAKSNSTITELIDNLSEISEKSNKEIKRTNEKPGAIDVQARLQAELSVLDSLQLTLTRVVEAERLKTQLELNKNNNEKAVNTEPSKFFGDQAVQTSVIEDTAESEIESINTEVEEEINTEDSAVTVGGEMNESHESLIFESVHESASAIESIKEDFTSSQQSIVPIEKSGKCFDADNAVVPIEKSGKKFERADSSESTAGISLQMLHRIIKDEELRSEHQLALIQLRLNSLIDKTKAELRLLEAKKRALKQRDGDNDQVISAIKKKQRGILLRYQTEKKEIDRLKKMHEIASEERIIMMKQQKQIQKMQVSTKTMLGRLKKDSPPKKIQRTHRVTGNNQVNEDISDHHLATSDTISSSVHTTNVSDFEVSPLHSFSEGEEEMLIRNQKTLQEKIAKDAEKLNRCRKFLGEREKKLIQEKHFVEEILEWENRLELEEKRLREMRRRAMNLGGRLPQVRSPRVKSVEDRSTSPFQYQEIFKSEAHKKTENEAVSEERSLVSSIQEALSGEIVTEDIPEEISKTVTVQSEYNESFEAFTGTSTKSGLVADKPLGSVKEPTSLSAPPVVIKTALSPRSIGRRRNSSGSDDSTNVSHTGTPSEQSDMEGRITALHEQLKKRKLEADRLRREQKKKNRERLKAKEESLLKQIQAYDLFIDKLKHDIEQEHDASPQQIIKPLMKQPKAERKLSKCVNRALGDRTDGAVAKNESAEEPHADEYESMHQPPSASASITEEASLDENSVGSIAEQPVSAIEESIDSVDESNLEATIAESIEAGSGSGPNLNDEASKNESVEDSLAHEENEDFQEITSGSSNSVKTAIPSSGKNESSEIATPSLTDELGGQRSSNKNSHSFSVTSEDKKSNNGTLTHVSSEKRTAQTQSVSDENIESEIDFDVGTCDKSSEGNCDEKKSETFHASLEQMLSVSDNELEVATEKDSEGSSINRHSDESNQSISEIAKIDTSEIPLASLENSEAKEKLVENGDEFAAQKDELLKEYLSDSFESVSEPDGAKDISFEIQEQFEDADVSDENISKEAANEKKADEIATTMLATLLNESLNLVDIAEGKAKSQSVEKLTEELIADLLDDSLDKVLGIYVRKEKDVLEMSLDEGELEEEPISPENITADIRRRIHEILAAQVPQGSSKPRARVRQFLRTAYDISPDSVSPTFDQSSDGAAMRDNFITSLLACPSANRKEVTVRTSQDLESQPWFDEFYGLSKTKKEAEQLRLQQLQIEQEIEQLQQAQSTPVPYYYMREIPNKPPPPYTPPGAAAASDKPPPPPTSREEITRNVADFTRTILDAVRRGKNLQGLAPRNLGPKDHFTNFLWDLARELVLEITRDPEDTSVKRLPWEQVPPPLSSCRSALRPRSEEDVVAAVLHRTDVALGFKSGVGQESLIVRWSRKKRGHVDELLIWESQAEEAEWTRYDEDLVTVKNEVAVSLFESLLQDTADALDAALRKKIALS